MSLTSKLVPYRHTKAPAFAEALPTYTVSELQRISHAVTSIEQIMAKLETSPVMATKAGAVTAADVPSGTWKIIWDTTNSTVKLYANMGGTLKSVALSS